MAWADGEIDSREVQIMRIVEGMLMGGKKRRWRWGEISFLGVVVMVVREVLSLLIGGEGGGDPGEGVWEVGVFLA